MPRTIPTFEHKQLLLLTAARYPNILVFRELYLCVPEGIPATPSIDMNVCLFYVLGFDALRALTLNPVDAPPGCLGSWKFNFSAERVAELEQWAHSLRDQPAHEPAVKMLGEWLDRDEIWQAKRNRKRVARTDGRRDGPAIVADNVQRLKRPSEAALEARTGATDACQVTPSKLSSIEAPPLPSSFLEVDLQDTAIRRVFNQEICSARH
jgi:hypothetical protein